MVEIRTKQGSKTYLVVLINTAGRARKALATTNPLRAYNTAREWIWKESHVV